MVMRWMKKRCSIMRPQYMQAATMQRYGARGMIARIGGKPMKKYD